MYETDGRGDGAHEDQGGREGDDALPVAASRSKEVVPSSDEYLDVTEDDDRRELTVADDGEVMSPQDDTRE